MIKLRSTCPTASRVELEANRGSVYGKSKRFEKAKVYVKFERNCNCGEVKFLSYGHRNTTKAFIFIFENFRNLTDI